MERGRQEALRLKGLDTESMIGSIRVMSEQIQKLTQDNHQIMREMQTINTEYDSLYRMLQSRNRTETVEYDD